MKVGKDIEAIEMFNKAIMKGPLNEEKKGRDMSLAVANRSAALLRLGYLKAAMEDVDLALRSGYPKNLRYKLFDRKIRIAANLNQSEIAFATRSDFIISLKDCSLDEKKKCSLENEIQQLLESLENKTFKCTMKDISYNGNSSTFEHKLEKANSCLPCLTDSVDIEFSPQRGRFAVANK